MSPLEYGGFNRNLFQETSYSQLCISLYTNQLNFNLADAFLGQSRGAKFQTFSVVSDPTMVGSPMSHKGL